LGFDLLPSNWSESSSFLVRRVIFAEDSRCVYPQSTEEEGARISRQVIFSRPVSVDTVTEFEPFGRRMGERFHQANADSTQSGEDRYCELFEEAPIAYLF
jgi:hypothetical protein